MKNITLVVMFVGFALLLDMVGITVLSVQNHPIPDILIAIGSGSLTGLVGLLVRPDNGMTKDAPPNP
jgi:hypothetical protein